LNVILFQHNAVLIRLPSMRVVRGARYLNQLNERFYDSREKPWHSPYLMMMI